ncbi:MAG: class I SAM-dependent methyltransferase [Actinomycetota bacterium]|nr:class I SAM-dependent methyltransferase [Actinomycetota bacterium]
MLERLQIVRDKILDRARVLQGDVVLDVGCGEGLLGFGALERGAERVIFCDISDDLLAVCRAAADELSLADRCHFVSAVAEDLGELADETVNVVTTRSVLIYVAEKQRAVEEFFRVLRPGGRMSVFEPINRFGLRDDDAARFWTYPSDGLEELAAKIHAIYDEIQPESDPMLDFDERDLLRLVEQAGFFPLELELQAEVRQTEPQSFDVFLHSSGNPKIPTFAEAMERALTAEERERVTNHLRPLVETGGGIWRMAHAYLLGVKP